MNSIELVGVSQAFGKVIALHDINLTFEEGKIYGLLGRNGAGKTTMLKIMYGMIYPTLGNVLADSKPVMDDDILGQMFFVGEKNYFISDATVDRNFRWMKDFRPEFDAGYAKFLADSFGLDVRKRIRALSTGYATLFKNILALASNAPFLLLDEPVLGLDANHRDMFYRFMLEKYGEKPFTAIISTHLVEAVASIFEHVVVINDGRIIKNEPRETLLASGYSVSGKTEAVREYVKDKEILGSDTLGSYETAYISGTRPKSGVPETLEIGKMDLQRLFIQLTNKKERKAI